MGICGTSEDRLAASALIERDVPVHDDTEHVAATAAAIYVWRQPTPPFPHCVPQHIVCRAVCRRVLCCLWLPQ